MLFSEVESVRTVVVTKCVQRICHTLHIVISFRGKYGRRFLLLLPFLHADLLIPPEDPSFKKKASLRRVVAIHFPCVSLHEVQEEFEADGEGAD